MEFSDELPFRILFQLFLALLLGGTLGLEREYKKKEAGLRTYALVSLGSCLFTILAFQIFHRYQSWLALNFDPGRIIQAIALGIGFIGAGIIIYRRDHIEGLTTAAGLWVAGAIGATVGSQFYWLATFATCLAILVLGGLHWIEKKYLKGKENRT